MPIYEFRCQACRRRSTILVRSMTESISPTCPACGGNNLVRAVSSFAYHKSEKTRLEEAGSPFSPTPDYYKDPRNIGRWAEERLKSLGIDMYSEEYWNTFSEVREMIAEAREGEMPGSLKDIL